MNLLLIAQDERNRWLRRYEYDRPWPDSKKIRARYLNAAKAARQLPQLMLPEQRPAVVRFFYAGPEFKRLSVTPDTTIEALLAAARPHFPNYRSDGNWRWEHTYALSSPTLGDSLLPRHATLEQLNITDGELLMVQKQTSKKIFDTEVSIPPEETYRINENDLSRYYDRVRRTFNPEEKTFKYHNFRLFATVLYTAEHEPVWRYLRRRYDKLGAGAGRHMTLLLLEDTADPIARLTHWRDTLPYPEYLAWSLLGWLRSRPYAPAALRPHLDAMHIDPADLPCVVFFDDVTAPDKVVRRLPADPAAFDDFFSDTFSAVTTELADTLGQSWLLNAADATSKLPRVHRALSR